jgi:hypothetical protein
MDGLVYTHNVNLTSILISNILHLEASISVKLKPVRKNKALQWLITVFHL